MKRFMKAVLRFMLAFLLGVVGMWFVLSFAWSSDEMSVAEKAVGVVYGILMVPLYEVITRVLRLR